jgi:hypothetical protein
MIKTFRGLMADDTQDTIVLHTNTGSTGYRIVNFRVMPKTDALIETTMKIYKIEQSTNTSDMDFSDNTLLAAAFYAQTASTDANKEIIIFDKEIFNQDIYITLKAHSSAGELNYYLELEQVKLDLNQNTVATLKDIRNVTAP